MKPIVDLGIDLGTTKCAATIAQDVGERAEYENVKIQQPEGVDSVHRLIRDDILPSVLYVNHKGQSIVGHAAATRAMEEPERSVTSVKLWLGRDVRLTVGDGKMFKPHDIAAEFLKAIVKSVRTTYQIRRCTITVPASFDLNQKTDILTAAQKASLAVGGGTLLDEPTAAFLSTYSYPHSFVSEMLKEASTLTVMVVDMGGGTLDVSVIRLELHDGVLHPTVLMTSQRTEGAGDHFDEAIARYIAEKFIFTNQDLKLFDLTREQQVSLAGSLLRTAQEIKIELSWQRRTSGSPGIVGRDVLVPTRTGRVAIPVSFKYEQLTDALTDYCNPASPVSLQVQLQKMLESEELQSRTEGNAIPDIVLLAGQMTQLWLVKEAIQQVVPGVRIEEVPGKPEYAIARGAAVQAANKMIRVQELPRDILLRTKRGFYPLARRGDLLPVPETSIPEALRVPVANCRGLTLALWEGSEEKYDELRPLHEEWVAFPWSLPEGEQIGLHWAMSKNYELSLTATHLAKTLKTIKTRLHGVPDIGDE